MRTGDWAAAITADLAVLYAFGDAPRGDRQGRWVGTSGTLAVREPAPARYGGRTRGASRRAHRRRERRDRVRRAGRAVIGRACPAPSPTARWTVTASPGPLIAHREADGRGRLPRGRDETAGPPGTPSTSVISTAWRWRTRRPAPGGNAARGRKASRCARDRPEHRRPPGPARRTASRTTGWRRTSDSSRGVIVLDNPTSTAATPAHPGLAGRPHPGLPRRLRPRRLLHDLLRRATKSAANPSRQDGHAGVQFSSLRANSFGRTPRPPVPLPATRVPDRRSSPLSYPRRSAACRPAPPSPGRSPGQRPGRGSLAGRAPRV